MLLEDIKMSYWKDKVLPKIKKVFEKNGPKKAAAAEACEAFDVAKVKKILFVRFGYFKVIITKDYDLIFQQNERQILLNHLVLI